MCLFVIWAKFFKCDTSSRRIELIVNLDRYNCSLGAIVGGMWPC